MEEEVAIHGAGGACGVDRDGFGCARHDGLAETVGEDARAGAGYEGAYALTTIPEVVEDMFDLYERVIEGCTVIVEGMGADISEWIQTKKICRTVS